MKRIYLQLALLISVSAYSQTSTVTTASFENRSAVYSNNSLNVSNFQSMPSTNAVELKWSTYTDNNLERLDVERSSNGSEFTVVGAVTAQNNTGAKYNFVDATPVQGVNYYRLRSVSRTGEFAYSKMLKIDMGEYRTDVIVVPNPVQRGIMNLQMNNFTKGKYALNMYNSSGQPVFRRTMNHAGGNSTELINLPATLKKGIYFLQITNGVSRMNKQVMVD